MLEACAAVGKKTKSELLFLLLISSRLASCRLVSASKLVAIVPRTRRLRRCDQVIQELRLKWKETCLLMHAVSKSGC
ncbi:hypothetical protein IWX47DRAFT_876640 [Phyllosticta citricarpa]